MKFKNPFRATVKAYWWNAKPNFGDALAPLLLDHFTDHTFEWDSISHAKIASIGSILEHIPPLWDGFVIGSGRLFEHGRLYLNPKVATILALRGPLTARGFAGSIALGDPGLLAPELVGPQEKQWDLGIVPHWQDDELAERFKKIIRAPHTVKVINAQDDPLTVVRQIGACRRIVTSSLHGMIIADAFGGIARRVEICPKMQKDGGDFKFRDYSAAIRTPFVVGKMMEPSRFKVEEAQFAIYDAYQDLKKRLK